MKNILTILCALMMVGCVGAECVKDGFYTDNRDSCCSYPSIAAYQVPYVNGWVCGSCLDPNGIDPLLSPYVRLDVCDECLPNGEWRGDGERCCGIGGSCYEGIKYLGYYCGSRCPNDPAPSNVTCTADGDVLAGRSNYCCSLHGTVCEDSMGGTYVICGDTCQTTHVDDNSMWALLAVAILGFILFMRLK